MKKKVFAVLIALMLTGLLFPGPSRTISLTVAADGQCSKEDVNTLVSILQDISVQLETDFAFRFRIAVYTHWDSGRGHKSINAMIPAFFKAAVAKKTDMFIGLTGRTDLIGDYGLSFYKEGYVLLRMMRNKPFFKRVLKHEIFHIFGASHMNNRFSIMDQMIRGNDLKSLNRELISIHRCRDFSGTRFPLPKQHLERVVSLYKKLAKANMLRNIGALRTLRSIEWYYRRYGSRITYDYIYSHRRNRPQYWRMADIYSRQAIFYTEMKNYPEAIQACKNALRLNQWDHEVFNLMGIAYRKSGKPEEAVKCYEEALARAPWAVNIRYNLGIAYWNNRQLKKALSIFREVVKENPHSADAWNNIGFILYRNNDLKNAVPCFKKALEINPNHPLARINLAKAKKGL